MMPRIAKVVQFAGIVITGVGLIYGVAENDMSAEFLYLGLGISMFVIGYFLERR